MPFEVPAWASAPQQSARLEVRKKNEVVDVHRISKQPSYVVGRQEKTCDVHLAHGSLSRQHAAFVHHEDGDLFLVDLGSSNGTFIDGQRVTGHTPNLLESGQVVTFANSTRTYTVQLSPLEGGAAGASGTVSGASGASGDTSGDASADASADASGSTDGAGAFAMPPPKPAATEAGDGKGKRAGVPDCFEASGGFKKPRAMPKLAVGRMAPPPGSGMPPPSSSSSASSSASSGSSVPSASGLPPREMTEEEMFASLPMSFGSSQSSGKKKKGGPVDAEGRSLMETDHASNSRATSSSDAARATREAEIRAMTESLAGAPAATSHTPLPGGEGGEGGEGGRGGKRGKGKKRPLSSPSGSGGGGGADDEEEVKGRDDDDDDGDDDDDDDDDFGPAPALGLSEAEQLRSRMNDLSLPLSHELMLEEHTKAVGVLAFDRKGSRLVTGSHDSSFKMWDFNGMSRKTHAFRSVTPDDGYAMVGLAYNPSGSRFIASSACSQPRLYDRDGVFQMKFWKGDTYVWSGGVGAL